MPHASALLVIDMQNALTAIAYRAAETVATIARLRERARAAGVPVVTVQHRGEGMKAGTEDGSRPSSHPTTRRSSTRRVRTASWTPISPRS